MVWEFLAADKEGVESIGAVGAVFEQVFFGLGELSKEDGLMDYILYGGMPCHKLFCSMGVVPIQRMVEGIRKRSQLEVDFVCNKGYQRYYIQSALEMPTDEKIRQVMASLRNIDDSFKKL